MKSIRISSILLFGLAVTMIAQNYFAIPSIASDKAVKLASISQILAEPSRYNQKLVRVIGYCNYRPNVRGDVDSLYLTNTDLPQRIRGKNVYLILDSAKLRNQMDKTIFANHKSGTKYVTVEGLFQQKIGVGHGSILVRQMMLAERQHDKSMFATEKTKGYGPHGYTTGTGKLDFDNTPRVGDFQKLKPVRPN
jgi:hypothetical protein